MMKFIQSLALVSLALPLVAQSGCPTEPCDPPAVDQSNYEGTDNAGYGIDYFGQSFTVGVEGELTSLAVNTSSAGTGVLRIYSGGISNFQPTGPMLLEQEVTWSAQSAPTDLNHFDLLIPLDVYPGEVYTFQLYSGAGINGHTCYSLSCYDGGSALGNPGDMIFETYVSSCAN